MITPAREGQFSAQLSAEDMLEFYWYMLLSRRADERAWVLHRQGKIPFHISGIGHEALQVALAFAVNRGGSNGNIIFINNLAETARFTNDGKVGIGTASPGNTLAVNKEFRDLDTHF